MVYIICLVLIIAAPLAHIVLSVKHINGSIKLSLSAITLICLVAGVILPLLASYIDIINLPSDIKCATASVGYAILGLLATLLIIPPSAIICYVIICYRRSTLKRLS